MSETPASPGRGAFVIGQLYHYAAAVVGVAMLLGGTIGTLIVLRNVLFPGPFGDGDGLADSLHGLAVALPGLAIVWWHLRRARRREARLHSEASWGSSLYYHLVAFVSLILIVIGVQLVLHGLIERLLFRCSDVISAPFPGACAFPPQVFDGLVFVLVAGPVWWWHLRQGGRLTEPAAAPGSVSSEDEDRGARPPG